MVLVLRHLAQLRPKSSTKAPLAAANIGCYLLLLSFITKIQTYLNFIEKEHHIIQKIKQNLKTTSVVQNRMKKSFVHQRQVQKYGKAPDRVVTFLCKTDER